MERLIYICDVCRAVMDEQGCAAICRNCGRVFDCADTASLQANARVSEDGQKLTLRPGADPAELLPPDPSPAAE